MAVNASRRTCAFVLVGLMGACASAPGTRPHDMSVEDHERAAEQEEQDALAHEQHYDPELWRTSGESCAAYCFSTWSNPTAVHRGRAQKHWRMAKKHREASKALRVAEARACEGIPERDRAVSPFLHREDILRVDTSDGTPDDPPESVRVVFREVESVSAGDLQRLVDCHVARNAALGHEVEGMDDCPLVPRGVAAKVEETNDGLAIRVSGSDPASRRDVYERAQRLLE